MYKAYRPSLLLAALLFLAGHAGTAAQSNNKSLGKKLDAYLTQAADFGFSGTALVAVDGEVVLEKGYGFADRARKTPIKADTVLELGSITKQFTAAAIMKLEMLGKLKTDDLLSRYIDGVPPDKADVTLHQLLTHSAGFPQYSGGDYDVSNRDETVARILATPLTQKPGTVTDYSNAGYSVLAAVVEKVSGQSYEVFLRDQLFKPAGMERTGYLLHKFDRATLPHGYVGEKDMGTVLDHAWSPSGPYWNLFGNGGIMSTVGDMFKWYKALQGNEIFSEAARKKIFTTHIGLYGYGWVINQTPNGLTIGHGGAGDHGFNARINWFPDKKTVVITMSNAGEYYGGMPFSAVTSGKLNSLLLGGDYVPGKAVQASKISASELSKYTGAYELATGGKFIVAIADGTLTVEPSGQAAVDALTLPADANAGKQGTTVTQRIVTGFEKGDFAPLRESMATDEAAARYRSAIEQRIKGWKASDGAFKSFEVLGTVPAWWSDDQQQATVVKVNFEKMPHFFRFHWKGDKIGGLGGEGIRSPIAIPLIPVSQNTFAGWHLVMSKNITVEFQLRNNVVSGMKVTTEGRTVTAARRSS